MLEENMMMEEAVETTVPAMEPVMEEVPATNPEPAVTAAPVAENLPATVPATHDFMLMMEGAVCGVVGWELGKWAGKKVAGWVKRKIAERKARKAHATAEQSEKE